ncbi:glycosyl transferase family 90 [Cellvibrio sp. ARAG 10.3]|uniref:glycosyl transferase family 90 n=1 Tax=Cellvibrio sp. ARAG 10.3 TaxID=3451358 RepID=UPI003F45BD91
MALLDQPKKNFYKFRYYLRGGLNYLVHPKVWQRRLDEILRSFDQLSPAEQQAIMQRVNYYNKLQSPFVLPEKLNFENQLYSGKKSAAYTLDFKSLIRYFPKDISYSYLFGDIVDVPDVPTFLKSRPICADQSNQNSVLLKLNKIRHYYVVKDKIKFEDKIPKLVWRGKSNRPERVKLLEEYFDNPVCDFGDTHHKNKRTIYERPFLTIPQQLEYRYILSIEGNDVATNLKWIMASNSLCFMRRPRFETWFMEGALIPDLHYVLLKDDHSDLEEKVNFYNEHPEEAQQIVANANDYMKKFFNEGTELLISLLVMDKYFRLSKESLKNSQNLAQ